MKMIVSSPEDMNLFAATVATTLSGGEVLGLVGELGSGKTAFVRGLVRALGSMDQVKSPSFTLLNQYRLAHPTIKYLIHVDLYRLEGSSTVVEEIGLDEWLDRDDVVIVIEWSEGLGKGFPLTKTFQFRYGDGETERIVEAITNSFEVN